MSLGARYDPERGGTRFLVWAPKAEEVTLALPASEAVPEPRKVRMEPALDEHPGGEPGYFRAFVAGLEPGARYGYRLDGGDLLPDPASRHQPEGVHGPSEVVRLEPPAQSGWRGLRRERYVFYEIHVGTMTPAGTFDGVVPHLDRLVDLGVTALEIMPVAEFPGERNWGYDGVCLYAAHHAYGGPWGLRRLTEACHERGLAVVLDVVYNHLGPEGNYLAQFGPYFTDRYHTPWGQAVNFDGADSDPVRRFFLENALWWLSDVGVDALRLDAVHAIADESEIPFLAELGRAVDELAEDTGREIHAIAESDANTLRHLRPRGQGGEGLDAQWCDDFHHALHTVLTGENNGYYQDFGTLAQLGRAMELGFVYTGQYSRYRRRRHGEPPAGIAPSRFVVCAQNHDQVGNRFHGERLASLVPPGKLRLAAGCLLLSPFLPLLFMGEEHGETAPFLYFVHHGDPELVEAVRQGRRREFEHFLTEDDRPMPDPQSPDAFDRSRPDWRRQEGEPLVALYRELLELRREVPALEPAGDGVAQLEIEVDEANGVLSLSRGRGDSRVWVPMVFSEEARDVQVPGGPASSWRRVLCSDELRFGGGGGEPPVRVTGGSTARLPATALTIYVLESSRRD